MPIPFADNFLAGSIISLLFPVALLIAIAVWYVLAARRFSSPGRPQPPKDSPPRAEGEGPASHQ
jgi:hypothetical protein